MDHNDNILDGQAAAGFGSRLTARATEIGLDMAELGRLAGIKKQSMSGYANGQRLCGSDKLFALSDALRVNARWLISGEGPKTGGDLVAADDADWILVSRYDLRQIHDDGKGEPLDPTPFRKDWLNITLGMSSGLWLAAMLTDYAPSGLAEGDLVFCQDIQPFDLIDGHLCFFRINGAIMTARYSVRPRGGTLQLGDRMGESIVTASEIGTADDQFVPVARILAKHMQKL